MITQRTTRSVPTHKAVMTLRPNPVAALAPMGGAQGQTKAEANRHPHRLTVEGQVTYNNRKRHHPVRRMRRVWPGPPTQQVRDLFRPYPSQLRGGPRRSV